MSSNPGPDFEYVCRECEALLEPADIGGHVTAHGQAAVGIVRRDIYEAENGAVDNGDSNE